MSPDSVRLEIAGRSVTGNVRATNEDSVLMAQTGPKSAWLAVCDGMGGAAAGEIASTVTTHVLASAVADGDARAVGRRLLHALQSASTTVRELGRREPRYQGMGTTATVLAVTSALDAVIGQVGDSRAYLLRGGHFVQLTRDQTVVQLMVERGQLTPEEAKVAPFANIILQAVGTADELLVDLARIALRPGDVLLLCSDGLPGAVSDEVMEEALRDAKAPAAACDELIDLALEAGATDNVSCIVARITSPDAPEPPSRRPEARPLDLLAEP